MADGELSDADVGIGAAAAQPAPSAPGGLLSDADVGIAPSTTTGALTNTGDEGYVSGAAKNVATGAIKGAGDAVGFAGNMGDLADYLVDRGEQGVRYLAGNSKLFDQIQSDNAAALQKTKQLEQQTPLGSLVAKTDPRTVLPDGAGVSAPILARTGNYMPDSYAGQLMQSGIEAVVGSIGPAGGGVTAGTGKAALLGTVAKQAPVVAATGTVGQGVSDYTGDPLLGMAAGNLAGTAGGGALHGAGKVIEPFAEKLPVVGGAFAGTQDRLAGQKLLATAHDRAAFQNALSPGPMQPGSDTLIEGFQPTTAQITGDPGVAQAERGAAAASPAPYVERRDAQSLAVARNIDAMTPTGSPEAVTAHLQDQLKSMDADADMQVGLAQKAAQAEASSIGTGAAPEVTGDDLRMHVAMANQAATQNASALWKAVDPSGTLANSTSAITTANSDIYGNLSDTAKAFVSPAEQTFNSLISSYKSVEPFQQLADLRSNLAAAMRQERATNGNSPAYARMSRLMGSVQSTINSAIENRAAVEAYAVATGAMSPEDTMVARVKQNWGVDADAVRSYASGNVARTGTDTGGLAGVGTTDGPRSVRAGSSAAGGAGQAPGDPRVPPQAPLAPNFDEAAAGRVKAATAATRDLHQTYEKGLPGDLLASRGTAGDYKLSNSAVPAKVFPGGPRGYDAIKQYQKATNNSPEAELSLHQAAAESLRQYAIGNDGMIDPQKLANWKNLHQHGLRAMDESAPGYSKRFDNASKATQLVTAEVAAQKAMRDHFQTGIVGKLLGADGDDEIVSRFGRIMNADDRVSQIEKLLATVRGNPDAMDGLRKTAAAWMARQFKTQTEIGSSGEKQVSAAAFKKIVNDKAPVLSKLFSAEEMGRFRQIAHALDIQNRSLTSKIAGGPGTAQDLNQAAKAGGHGSAKPASSISEAMKSGAMLGYVAHGFHGAAWGAATGGAGHIVNALRAMGIDNVQKLYNDALLNPERARYYLAQVPEALPNANGRLIAANLRRTFLTGPQIVRSQQPQQRAFGGRVAEPTAVERILASLPRRTAVDQAMALIKDGRKAS